MKLFRGIGELLSLAPAMAKEGRRVEESDLGILSKAAMVVHRGRIQWIGPEKKIPRQFTKSIQTEVHLNQATVLPGFIECHTHSIFAGNRAAEFEMRNQGVSYQEIAARGGGILSTVRGTRKASAKELLEVAQRRAQVFVNQGVTTLEVKSGYALNLKDEVKMLEVAAQLKGPQVVRTFLGAHALPPEFSSADEYVTYLQEKVLPIIARKKLAERVDIFIEEGFFSKEQGRRLLCSAQALGMGITIHADQLSLSGGGDLAVELGASSADHLLKIETSQIQYLALSETTAVLLPTADLYMRVAYPPARRLIDAGARVALATDFNPGTAPSQDLNLVGLLARLEMKMTLPEVIAAYTVGASFALQVEKERGSLEQNKYADFVCTHQDWRTLFYSVGETSIASTYREGRKISKVLN